jgi:microcystin-dependent protein
LPATFPIPLISVIPGQTITASLWNNEYGNISDNFVPAGMDDYSSSDSQMQTAVDPYPGAATSRPTSLQGEIERIRYQLAQMLGETYWYIDPDASLANLDSRLDAAEATLVTLVPPGVISAYGGTTAPTGYLLCDGTAVGRVTYAALFAVIGSAFGSGDGTSTFNVPDLRGRFLRGKDGGATRDPDRASRTAMNSGGNTGDNVGSVQGGATADATGAIDVSTAPDHQHTQDGNAVSVFNSPGTGGFACLAQSGTKSVSASGAHSHTLSGFDNETRPVNANVNYIIKI